MVQSLTRGAAGDPIALGRELRDELIRTSSASIRRPPADESAPSKIAEKLPQHLAAVA